MRYGQFLRYLLLAVLFGIGSSAVLAQEKALGDTAPAIVRDGVRARLDLLDTVSRMVEVRHITNPHGYEKSDSFTGEFYLYKTRLEKLLASDGPTAPSADKMLQSLAQAIQEYERNREDFSVFHFSIIMGHEPKLSEELARIEPQQLLGTLLTFTLLVEARDPELAKTLKKGSYVWPFCRTQNSTVEKSESKKRLLVQLVDLKQRGFSIPFMMELAHRTKLSEPLTADDLVVWTRAGIPNEVIRAALESSTAGH
ncbi:MAG TPA: hypothetical protein VF173_07285 [Thermoanaerobaculia bacterium]|nr:hypothetical protein [Thermoanaerobaculia bacterium]